MPILNAETTLFPETLLSDPAALSTEWWALYTFPRQEKTLCRTLLKREISFYCPVVPHSYRSPSGRARTSHLPLFSNYVFLNGDELSRYHAVSTGYVNRCLPVENVSAFVADLSHLQRLILSGLPLTMEDHLVAGTKVRVKSGPLMGVEGSVIRRRNENRLLIQVDFLQQGASIEIGDWDLEPLL